MHKVRTLTTVGVAALVTIVSVALAPTSPAGAAPVAPADTSCAAYADPIYEAVKPSNGSSLLTASSKELGGAANFGYTQNLGTVFFGSKTAQPGLVPVTRLYRSMTDDFLFTRSVGEVASAQKTYGYKVQGTTFYASASPSACLVPVLRYRKNTKHRLTLGADKATLTAAGWISEGVSFYAAPSQAVPTPTPVPKPRPTPTPTPTPTPKPSPAPTTTPPVGAPPVTTPVDNSKGSFSFAVMPDTQQEVLRSNDTRFVNRTSWLVKQKAALNLKFVTHTGDVHNWDTPSHDQYEMSSKAMKVLEAGKIPYSLAIGNHDTEATGVGGGARDTHKTRILQRDTTTFNSYYNAARYGGVSGAFEKNKVDNIYSIYSAGGEKWMVLVLELWPRQSVVDWAKTVVASHPDSNVIVVTHDYLNADGGLEQSGEYGNLSPQALYDQLVKQYSNIKMVVSGHVGFAASRIDTGVHGNKIYSFMTTIHSTKTNPTRMFTIDTKAGTLKTWIYCPYTNETYTQYSQTLTGVQFVQ